MSAVIARAALILVLLAFALGVWIGYSWGGSDQEAEVKRLGSEVAALTAERDEATAAANGNASNLTSLRDTLKAERESRLAQQKAAAAELDARTTRIAQLERQAAMRRQALVKKVETDEDCTVLRSMPVCAALADGLYGQPAAAGPH